MLEAGNKNGALLQHRKVTPCVNIPNLQSELELLLLGGTLLSNSRHHSLSAVDLNDGETCLTDYAAW